MNLTEQRAFMGSELHNFLVVDEDHDRVAGSKAAGVTLAAILYRAYPDNARIELGIHEIIKLEKNRAQSRRTVIRCMAQLFQRGILERSAKPGRDNRYAFTLNRERICYLLAKAKGLLPDVPSMHYQPNSVVPKVHHPNKEVRDIGRLRDKKETHQEGFEVNKESCIPTYLAPEAQAGRVQAPPVETQKPEEPAQKDELEQRIEATLEPYTSLFPRPFDQSIVTCLAKIFRGRNESYLIECLEAECKAMWQYGIGSAHSWGVIVARAKKWKCPRPETVAPCEPTDQAELFADVPRGTVETQETPEAAGATNITGPSLSEQRIWGVTTEAELQAKRKAFAERTSRLLADVIPMKPEQKIARVASAGAGCSAG